MVSSEGEVKVIKLKNHKNTEAILYMYWDSSWGEGYAEINFLLHNIKTNETIFIKKFKPRAEYYISGEFDEKDVLNDFGNKFKDWVKRLEKAPFIKWDSSIRGSTFISLDDFQGKTMTFDDFDKKIMKRKGGINW